MVYIETRPRAGEGHRLDGSTIRKSKEQVLSLPDCQSPRSHRSIEGRMQARVTSQVTLATAKQPFKLREEALMLLRGLV